MGKATAKQLNVKADNTDRRKKKSKMEKETRERINCGVKGKLGKL